MALSQEREHPGVLPGVVVTQPLTDGQAVHPELGAQPRTRLGDLLADQGKFPPERVVDSVRAVPPDVALATFGGPGTSRRATTGRMRVVVAW